MDIHYRETTYGFEWGASKVERGCSDKKQGWVTLIITTPKYENGIQVYITKTGKVRVSANNKEWMAKEQPPDATVLDAIKGIYDAAGRAIESGLFKGAPTIGLQTQGYKLALKDIRLLIEDNYPEMKQPPDAASNPGA